MKNSRIRSLAVLFALILVLLSASCGGAQTPVVTLRLTNHNTDGSMTSQSIDVLAEKIFEATNGRVKIDCYHGGVLGSFADSINMIESGVADLAWTSVSMFAGQFPYSEVFQLPMLGLTSAQKATEVWWDVMDKYPEVFEHEFSNFKLLVSHTSPPACIGLDRPVNNLGDLRGANMRTTVGPNATIVRLWNANPVSMSPADMYLGMQRGVINGYIFDGAGINTWGLAELTENVVDVGLSYSVNFILMNKDVWESLSPEDQAAIDAVAGRAGSQYGAFYMQKEADDLFAEMGDSYQKLSAADLFYEELRAPLATMYDDWLNAPKPLSSVNVQEFYNFVLERIAYREN